jgi:hypothetical protein
MDIRSGTYGLFLAPSADLHPPIALRNSSLIPSRVTHMTRCNHILTLAKYLSLLLQQPALILVLRGRAPYPVRKPAMSAPMNLVYIIHTLLSARPEGHLAQNSDQERRWIEDSLSDKTWPLGYQAI